MDLEIISLPIPPRKKFSVFEVDMVDQKDGSTQYSDEEPLIWSGPMMVG